ACPRRRRRRAQGFAPRARRRRPESRSLLVGVARLAVRVRLARRLGLCGELGELGVTLGRLAQDVLEMLRGVRERVRHELDARREAQAEPATHLRADHALRALESRSTRLALGLLAE